MKAEKAATAAGVSVQWVKSDAAKFTPTKRFDAAICLCEGAFGLLGGDDADEHDRAILRNINAALHAGGSFLMTTENGYARIRAFTQEDVESVWGGTAGNWGHRKIDLDEIEVMIVATKIFEIEQRT